MVNMNGLVGTFAPTHARTGRLFEPEASRVQGERSTVELRAHHDNEIGRDREFNFVLP